VFVKDVKLEAMSTSIFLNDDDDDYVTQYVRTFIVEEFNSETTDFTVER